MKDLYIYCTLFKVYELFGRAGDVRRVIMGLDRFKKTPCGFCFVELVPFCLVLPYHSHYHLNTAKMNQYLRYYTRDEAENAIRCVNGTRLDDRVIR